MKRDIIQRTEMHEAILDLGGAPIELADYATTGLRIVMVGPSGIGKTNAGALIAEQLAAQGWISALVDPEGELESLYGDAVRDADALSDCLKKRDKKIIVISAENAADFLSYGNVIMEAADKYHKPIFAFIDEGQLFSQNKKRKNGVGEASDIINDLGERGRKRALDLFITAHRFTGSISRSNFTNKNLTLIGRQEDPTVWSSLAPMFRSSKIEFNDLLALSPGEFFCFSRRGMEKIKMPMAEALKKVAPKAKTVKPVLPATFSQWARAMGEIPPRRLGALTDPVVHLLGAVAGLSSQQMMAGMRALQDERETRA
jgi:hypothetical protein